ncbi:MAG: hypothetical protein ETSY2_51470, partial [Candidatus Entotheonella gemina]
RKDGNAPVLPSLAGKKISLSFAPATEADAQAIASYVPDLPTDGSPVDLSQLRVSLPGYLIRMVAEFNVDGETVAQSSAFPMGTELVSNSSLFAPVTGWKDAEDNRPIVGEYRAIAIDPAGISSPQLQSLADKINDTQSKLESGDFNDLNLKKLIGDKLYSVILGYLAADDLMRQSDADAFQIVSYRKPSFGSFTLVAQPQYIFSVPKIVSFVGLEIDVDQLVSVIVRKDNNRNRETQYIINSEIRQSAYEYIVQDAMLTNIDYPGESISAVKAIRLASLQGQKIYNINQSNIDTVLTLLNIDEPVIDEIRQSVGTGKHAIVSQNNISLGGWTGVGYIIIDPHTGSGAYKISGGANGAFFIGILAGAAMILFVATGAGAFLIPGVSLLFTTLLTIESIIA